MFDDINLFSAGYDVFTVTATWIVGCITIVYIGRKVQLDKASSIMIYIWHTLWCLVVYWVTLDQGSDAILYYNISVMDEVPFSIGTIAVAVIARPFTLGLNFSFLSIFMVFNIFGSIGLLLFYASAISVRRMYRLRDKSWILFLIFLPSLSFWTSAMSKDAITFLGCGMLLWGSLNLKNRLPLLFAAIVLILIVRPHIALAVVTSLIMGLVVVSGMGRVAKSVTLIVGLGVCAVLMSFVVDYIGLTDANFNNLANYIDSRQEVRSATAGIDLQSMPLPLQMFTYMFRPLPFEASGMLQILASLENMILLAMFIYGISMKFKPRKKVKIDGIYFLLFYALLTWVVLSMTTPNLGISVRQRCMFLPVFLLFVIILDSQSANSGSRRADTNRQRRQS